MEMRYTIGKDKLLGSGRSGPGVSIVFISAGKLKLKSIRHMFQSCSMFANLKYVPQRDPDKVFGEDYLEY